MVIQVRFGDFMGGMMVDAYRKAVGEQKPVAVGYKLVGGPAEPGIYYAAVVYAQHEKGTEVLEGVLFVVNPNGGVYMMDGDKPAALPLFTLSRCTATRGN